MTIALSHSRLSTFQQCPLKFRLQFLDKAFPQEDESKSVHLVRGKNVHKALETYIVKKRVGEENIPPSSLPEVERAKPLIDDWFKIFKDVLPESQIAINKNWEQVDWFSHEAYYRAIIDAIALAETTALVIDWKTGKINDYAGYGGQLHLTAAIVMKIFQKYEEVTTAYLYVDHKKTFKIKFQRAELDGLVEHFDNESVRVNAETEFAPKPNDFCGWCAATKTQCRYSRKL